MYRLILLYNLFFQVNVRFAADCTGVRDLLGVFGKASNENHAVREVYRLMVEDRCLDPFQILVTVEIYFLTVLSCHLSVPHRASAGLSTALASRLR